MTDKPIIFSGPMVRALLDGRKTQTRRVLIEQPGGLDRVFQMDDGSWHQSAGDGTHMSPISVPYTPGDRLWVRETFATDGPLVRYYATDDVHELRRKRPSIHMPRWASRLTLTVTDVRVQRVREIDGLDAIAEGIERVEGQAPWRTFKRLWDSINAKRGFGWDANPWVCALSFTVERRNIDEIEAARRELAQMGDEA